MRIRNKGLIFFGILSLIFSLSACKESGTDKSSVPEKKPVVATDTSNPEGTQEETQVAVMEEPAADKTEITITDESFGCIRDMEQVGSMYLANLLGDIEGTLAVANSTDGGVYPPGSVVQLLPGEAMVKLHKGASAATNDWEFFVLDVSEQGAKIKQRGFDKVGNMFGTCLACHKQAAAQDMICGAGQGCAPITFPGIDTEILTSALQKADKRCPPDVQPTQEEIEALKKLGAIIQAAKEAAVESGGQQ